MHSEKLVLSAGDYAIIGSTLSVSATIGIYFRFTSKRSTNDEFLFAGRNMSILPVAFSLMASFFSATNMMGVPAEMYLYGTNMAFMNIGFIVGPIISAYVFLPVFFNNEVSTTYEYLEMRFGKIIRRIMSSTFGMSTILFTAASLYAPALALSAVTNLSMWSSILSTGFVCTFYCTLGGMKAVLWADVFQATLMFVGLLVIIIRGCLLLGGVANVFETAFDGGRLIVPIFSFDMGVHYTFFNILFQGFIMSLGQYGGGQMQVQRLLTLKNLKSSKIACILSIPMVVAFQFLCCFAGLIFYAYYITCDPLTSPSKPIYSVDQLLPYFIISTMSGFPGLPGLCVSGIFSASLSTVSSAINCLASVSFEDFIRPIFPKVSNSVFYTKGISLFYGIVCIALSFLMSSMGNLIRMLVLILGLFFGPNLGVFILAACSTSANEEGAVFGVLSGIAVAACLTFIPEQRFDPPLPLSNECPDLQNVYENSTLISILPEPTLNPGLNSSLRSTTKSSANGEPFHLAYMWISSIGLLTCLVVGYTTSMVTNYFKGNTAKIPEVYLSPIRTWFSRKNKPKEVLAISTISGDVKKTISS